MVVRVVRGEAEGIQHSKRLKRPLQEIDLRAGGLEGIEPELLFHIGWVHFGDVRQVEVEPFDERPEGAVAFPEAADPKTVLLLHALQAGEVLVGAVGRGLFAFQVQGP